jgi:hypothetical protein
MEQQASTATAPAASPAPLTGVNAEVANDTAADRDIPAGADTTEGGESKEPKPEKTEAERERIRMQRGIDRRTRQLAEERAEKAQLRAELDRLTTAQKGANYQNTGDDSEPLSLTRKQIQELVTSEAQRLAQTVRSQQTEVELRQSVVGTLAKTWGQEKFDEIASDLDDAFGGLRDGDGREKPATAAVFVADNPARVIEYLANPDNGELAERISKMNTAQASKEITKLEAKFAVDDVAGKPKASKAGAPLEAVKGRGPANKDLLSLSGDEFNKRRQEQIKNRR